MSQAANQKPVPGPQDPGSPKEAAAEVLAGQPGRIEQEVVAAALLDELHRVDGANELAGHASWRFTAQPTP